MSEIIEVTEVTVLPDGKNEVTRRSFTAAENEQRLKDAEAALIADGKAELARAAALAKLAALGLTVDDLTALGL